MLDGAPPTTYHTEWVLRLFLPLRRQAPWGKPIQPGDLIDYLQLHDLAGPETFFWVSLADQEAVAWMLEKRQEAMDAARRGTRRG